MKHSSHEIDRKNPMDLIIVHKVFGQFTHPTNTKSNSLFTSLDIHHFFFACKDKNLLAFQKQAEHYNVDILSKTRLILIGTFNNEDFILSCARIGFEEFILIDTNTTYDSNIAMQDSSLTTSIKPESEVLAEQILQINPLASVIAITSEIENIADSDFHQLASRSLRFGIEKNLSRFCFPVSVGVGTRIPILPTNALLIILSNDDKTKAQTIHIGEKMALPTISFDKNLTFPITNASEHFFGSVLASIIPATLLRRLQIGS